MEAINFVTRWPHMAKSWFLFTHRRVQPIFQANIEMMSFRLCSDHRVSAIFENLLLTWGTFEELMDHTKYAVFVRQFSTISL